jgi:hypothetical protein
VESAEEFAYGADLQMVNGRKGDAAAAQERLRCLSAARGAGDVFDVAIDIRRRVPRLFVFENPRS